MNKTPYFPSSVWDGTSSERSSSLISRPPEADEWDQVVAEIASIEAYLASLQTRVIRSFVLGSNTPVTVGDDKIGVLFVPSTGTKTLQLVRLGAKVVPDTSDLEVEIIINLVSVGTFSLPVDEATNTYPSVDFECEGGEIITVNVNQADGTVQNVTVDLEFLV